MPSFLDQPPTDAPHFPPVERPSWSKKLLSSRGARWTLVAAGVLLFLVVAGWPWLQEQSHEVVARYWMQRAATELLNGDKAAALANLDRALPWAGDNPMLHYERAMLLQDAGKLSESLADFDRVIQLNPNFARAYTGRALVYQRLGRHTDALADVNKAVRESPASDPEVLNNRAYARALAGVELEEGLDDVQKAIKRGGEDNAAYLDTRGYLYYLLDNNQAAMADLNRAIEITAKERTEREKLAREKNVAPKVIESWLRSVDHMEAVMVQHRGLVHEKLGQTEQAQADFERAKKMGYDPAAGVF